jgi:hypothetical protein
MNSQALVGTERVEVVGRSAPRVEPLPEALLSTVLRPYNNKGCRYIQHASIATDDGAASLDGSIRGRAQFAIAKSCYIDDTGHFNAVEFTMCFNQLAYVYGAYLATKGLLPGVPDMVQFEERQLPGMLITELSSRYRKAINARCFEGEAWIWNVERKEVYWRLDMKCRFWDAADGKADGSVVIALLNSDRVEHVKPR